MKRALCLARANGGGLCRYDYRYQQFWAEPGRVGFLTNYRFSARTIQALVNRGLALYTDFRETEVGEFAREPIEVTLTAKGAEV